MFLNFLKSKKKYQWRSLVFLVKLQAFTETVNTGVLIKVFAKFTAKHLRQRLHFNKVAGLRM